MQILTFPYCCKPQIPLPLPHFTAANSRPEPKSCYHRVLRRHRHRYPSHHTALIPVLPLRQSSSTRALTAGDCGHRLRRYDRRHVIIERSRRRYACIYYSSSSWATWAPRLFQKPRMGSSSYPLKLYKSEHGSQSSLDAPAWRKRGINSGALIVTQYARLLNSTPVSKFSQELSFSQTGRVTSTLYLLRRSLTAPSLRRQRAYPSAERRCHSHCAAPSCQSSSTSLQSSSSSSLCLRFLDSSVFLPLIEESK